MKKTVKKVAAKAKALTATLQALVTTVATCGFTTANAYADCVVAVQSIVKETRPGSTRNRAIEAAALGYKSGYVARSLLVDPAYGKRWGNMSIVQQIEEGTAIIALAAPTSSKPERRTDAEHKACRAADVSWFKVKQRAGLAEPKKNAGGRKPRPGTNPSEPPRDMLFASPKLANDNEAREYFKSGIAALLTTTSVNQQTGIKKDVKHVAFLVQSIIADAKAKIEKALA